MADSLSLVGSKTGRDDRRLLGASPVVVGGNDGTRRVVQLKVGIEQHTGDRQRRANRAHDYLLRLPSGNNEAADQHLVAGLDQPARGDIPEHRLWRGRDRRR